MIVAVLDHLKELLAIVGLLTAYAGIISVWVKTRTTVEQMRKELSMLQQAHVACSQKQTDRFQELLDRLSDMRQDTHDLLSELRVELGATTQQLKDYIEWQKNNGNKQ